MLPFPQSWKAVYSTRSSKVLMNESNIWTAVVTLVVALTSSKGWDYWKHKNSIKQQVDAAERADQNLYRDDLRIKLDEYRKELKDLYKKREEEMLDMQSKIRKLSEDLSAMRVKVEFLEKENKQLVREFLGAILGSLLVGKLNRDLKNDPIIKQSAANIKKIEKQMMDKINKKRKQDPDFAKKLAKAIASA